MAALQTKVPAVILLTDPALEVLAAWGVLMPGEEHPIPATFVVAADGKVTWRYVYQANGDWPPYGQLLDAVK